MGRRPSRFMLMMMTMIGPMMKRMKIDYANIRVVFKKRNAFGFL